MREDRLAKEEPGRDLSSMTRLRMLASFLDRKNRRLLTGLFAVMCLIAVLEIVGIALVLPFLQLVADPDVVEEKSWLGWLYEAGGFSSYRQLLVACGVAVILSIGLANLVAAFSIWQRQRLSWAVAHNLSMRLARTYVDLPYRFFQETSSAELIKKNIEDVNGVVNGVFLAGSQLIISLIVTLLITGVLIAIEPRGTLVCGAILFGIFLAVAVFRKAYLSRLGRERLAANSGRYRAFVDLVTGVKTVKTDGAKPFFIDRFEGHSRAFSILNPRVLFAAAVPRYVIEALAFGSVVAVTIFLVLGGSDLSESLPLLTTFTVAGYRLIPALAGAFTAFAQMVSNLPAIDAIYADLAVATDADLPAAPPLTFEKGVAIEGVSFRHNEFNPLAVDQVTLRIRPGEKVAFVGPSGSGKTTLVDILMGLYEPQEGSVRIDGTRLDRGNRRHWRGMIGYVPQDIFIYEDTLARNIAFGDPDIDTERLRRVCDWSELQEVVERALPDGYDTMLGEHGSRLSGGQRQRIGLARALYRDPQILVLDEATSALDTMTERKVIDNLARALPDATVVMIAHRLSTVRHCDRLIVMDQGRVVAEGSYDDLLHSNDLFQELVRIS